MTLKELYNFGRHELAAFDFPTVDTAYLTEKFFGKDRQSILKEGNEVPDGDKQQAYIAAVKKRKEGFPLQYILGWWYFMDMRLRVKPGVLVPREDTEVLVRKAAEFIGDKPLKGVDLCSGTGAVALGIIHLCKNAELSAVELYSAPLECLEKNVGIYGKGRVKPEKRNVLEAPAEGERYDFIVANPPYVTPSELEELQIEVKNEPREALIGGEDGLDYYRAICEKWTKCLVPGGLMAFEIGESQGEAVRDIMKAHGFENIEITEDFSGLDRTVSGVKGA